MQLHERILKVLEKEMVQARMSKYRLAEDSDVAQSTMRDFFKAGNSINLVVLNKVCKTLGVDVWRIVRMAELNKVE